MIYKEVRMQTTYLNMIAYSTLADAGVNNKMRRGHYEEATTLLNKQREGFKEWLDEMELD